MHGREEVSIKRHGLDYCKWTIENNSHNNSSTTEIDTSLSLLKLNLWILLLNIEAKSSRVYRFANCMWLKLNCGIAKQKYFMQIRLSGHLHRTLGRRENGRSHLEMEESYKYFWTWSTTSTWSQSCCNQRPDGSFWWWQRRHCRWASCLQYWSVLTWANGEEYSRWPRSCWFTKWQLFCKLLKIEAFTHNVIIIRTVI